MKHMLAGDDSGKTLFGMSTKRGCLRNFVGKPMYLDGSLFHLIYDVMKHANALGEHCHGTMIGWFRHALGVGLSEDMKTKIAQMHTFGLSPTQIMGHHTKEVRELALKNGVVI